MVRKLMSDAEDAVLDLRERREERRDSGTRVQEDGLGLLTRAQPFSAGLAPLRSRGWQSGTRSSLVSSGEATGGAEPGVLGQRRGSGSAAVRVSSRWCFLRWWWLWCR